MLAGCRWETSGTAHPSRKPPFARPDLFQSAVTNTANFLKNGRGLRSGLMFFEISLDPKRGRRRRRPLLIELSSIPPWAIQPGSGNSQH
jgi:hypothetical protein